MKKLFVIFVIFITVLLSSCRNYTIDAKSGSKWESLDNMIAFTITEGKDAIGTLIIQDKALSIICYFGPGKTEFSVYPKETLDDDEMIDGDALLFRGDYYLDKNEETITFDISEDKIGANVKKSFFTG